MGKSCTILAYVKTPSGEVVESNLYKDLLHYTSNDRELTKEYYAVGTNQEFLAQVKDSEDFETDENGEITFHSLRTLSKMDLETDKLVKTLNEDIGEGEYSYTQAIEKIQRFNGTSEFADTMLATMHSIGKGRYYVSVVPKVKTVTDGKGKRQKEGSTSTEEKKLHDTIRNKELEDRIKDLLRRHKVSVKFLEADEEGGRYSTENAVKTEQGLWGLIEVNEKGKVSEVLAEEAGHFAIGALGDNPLVKRIEELLEDPAMQEEALGSAEYNSSMLGKNPPREVAGRLVGKALMNKLDNSTPYRTLANRIANLAKRVFYKITGNEVRWAVAKAEQIANKIAYGFVEGDNSFNVQNAIDIGETMRNSTLSINQQVYSKIIDELGRMCKQLDAFSEKQFASQTQASLALAVMAGTDSDSGESALQMAGVFGEALAFDGIVQSLVQVTDYLTTGGEIDQLMEAVDLDNPADFYANMARNGKKLRQARAFLKSTAIILSTISSYLDHNNVKGTLKLPSGSTITNVNYQDEYGVWKTINMKHMLSVYKGLVEDKIEKLSILESHYFVKFCEDVYGSKYITTTTGILWSNVFSKNKDDKAIGENTISIADMVEGLGMDDIDVFHRYLGSMSNNPDIIGQIVDKVVKAANKNADAKTIQYQERLIILKDRAEQLGLDTADLVEKDEKGIPTGNMITPPASQTLEGNREEDYIYDAYMDALGYVPAVNYGKWENARKKAIEDLWEDFKSKNPDWASMSGYTRGYKWTEFRKKAMKEWNKENSIKVEVLDPDTGDVAYVKWVPSAKYESDAWDNLMSKYPKKAGDKDSLSQWVYDYRKIKEELDGMLPVGATSSYRLPQFKGTFMNSVRNSRALEKGKFKTLNSFRKTFGRRVVLENFVETAEDTEFGDLHTMNSPEDELLGNKLNYEQERAARVPVFGINKLTNLNDLDTDLCSSMLAYASMATSYKGISDVVDALEVGRMAMYNRNLEGKNNIIDKTHKAVGDRYRKFSGEHELYEYGSKNRAYGRYLKFLERQVYGITATHWGIPIWKNKRLLLHKMIQNLSSLGGTLFLKGNVLGGSVNTLTGFNNIFKEAIVGEDITAKGWAAAHGYYFKHFPQMWSTDLGKLRKENRLSLFLEKMNTQGDNKTKFRNWKTNRSRLNNFYRMAGYLPYSSGDHYMQAMSYLAVAHDTMLYNVDGTEGSNLWNAYQRKKNTDEFDNFSKGQTLSFVKFCPTDAQELTSSIIDKEGVYLKKVGKTVSDFEDWLVFHDERWADETYKHDHVDDYNTLRDQFENLSDKDLMFYRANKYEVLYNILKKTEDYLNSSSPLVAVPVYSAEELQYLRSQGLGGDYANILQNAKDSIYHIIWTSADESAYMDRCREINNRLHGIYNQQDKTAWHNQWYTNAFLAMKGWALGYLEMMYSPNHHSIILGREVEGFINTAAKIPMSAICGWLYGKDHMNWRDVVITMVAPWSKRSQRAMKEAGFTEDQNFNARRMVMAELLITFLWILRMGTEPPDKESGEEPDTFTGLMHYLAGRTLYEQQVFIYPPETFTQSGQLLDFMPVGVAAAYDIGKLAYQGTGAALGIDDTDFFYSRDDRKGRYEAGDTKFMEHLERITPYWKSWWGIFHPYEAYENYEFGRKMRTR